MQSKIENNYAVEWVKIIKYLWVCLANMFVYLIIRTIKKYRK